MRRKNEIKIIIIAVIATLTITMVAMAGLSNIL
jgi:hypothetical protein